MEGIKKKVTMKCLPVPVAVRSNVYVFSHSPAEIVSSNPTGDMDVCLLWMLCVVW